jgi:hypothetical protein
VVEVDAGSDIKMPGAGELCAVGAPDADERGATSGDVEGHRSS